MNTNNQLIKKLAFETIDDKYSYALYGDLKVIMDMTNGYINATKLSLDGGKKFCHWLENKGNKKLNEYFENVDGNRNSDSHNITFFFVIIFNNKYFNNITKV